MTENEKKFDLYLTVLRFLSFKITDNLKRIYLNIDLGRSKMFLTAFYKSGPSTLELELLDDIVTDSNAHIPDLYVESGTRLMSEFDENEQYDFIVFSVYDAFS